MHATNVADAHAADLRRTVAQDLSLTCQDTMVNARYRPSVQAT